MYVVLGIQISSNGCYSESLLVCTTVFFRFRRVREIPPNPLITAM